MTGRTKKFIGFIIIIFIACIFLIIGTIAGAALFITNSLQPTDAVGQSVEITIGSGMSSNEIATVLEDKGIVRNASIFTYYLKYKNEGRRFQAGRYEMFPGMELNEIIIKFNSGDVVPEPMIRFTIPEGFTVKQITEKLTQEGLVNGEKFTVLWSEEQDLKGEAIKKIPENSKLRVRLEGYIFPETYEMKAGSTEKEILERMLTELDRKLLLLPGDWQAVMEQKKLSLHEILTIASLIEREVVVDEERFIVSGVIHNRLSQKRALEIDATIQYLLEKQKERLLYVDLEVDNPYNTYKYAGLPPGPIASPGLKSIEAALYPAETKYLFYVTKKDGTFGHLFGETFEEHKRNIAESNRTK